MTADRRAEDRPAGRRRTITRRTVLKALAATGVGVATGGGAYGFLYERHAVGLTTATLPVVNLPVALEGFTIGLLTDVHRSRWVSAADVAEAVELLMRERPRLIVLGGDYVTWGNRGYVEAAADALSSLDAPDGVFGILGNHDDDHDMPAALAKRRVQVLKDARTQIVISGEKVGLIGVRFWTKRQSDIAMLLRGAEGMPILLAHDPRRLSEAAALGIPLVLSGHTHGGQVVLPGMGAIAGQKFPVISGLGRQAQTTVFVSRGVGTVYVPVRINCPPEVAILTLTRARSLQAVDDDPRRGATPV
jgi:predicted MPP superfamily phosphohydrolase